MGNPSSPVGSDRDLGAPRVRRSHGTMPRWVKVFAATGLILLLALAVLHVTGLSPMPHIHDHGP